MDNEMNLQEPIKSSNTSAEEEMKTLAQKLFMAKMDLGKTKSARKRRDLQEYIDGLKVDLGWTFLDCKEYEKGLALLSSVSWKIHGEMKCNEMARALTEMGHYNEAMGLLKRGLRIYPHSYALWIAMGALYEVPGDDFESLKCIEIALQFAPRIILQVFTIKP
jgi:tetratricopeptide (TPR) repeat protein